MVLSEVCMFAVRGGYMYHGRLIYVIDATLCRERRICAVKIAFVPYEALCRMGRLCVVEGECAVTGEYVS